MQFKALALAALAAGVSAQQSAVPTEVQASVLSVLLTALPPSALNVAATNQPAFQSEIASSIAAGKTPEWYQALPSDVKTLLTQIYPVSTPAVTTPSATASAAGSSSVTPTPESSAAASASGTITIPVNSTIISTVSSATLASTGGANSQSPSSTASTGGASYPTAVVGAGVAGALGFLGMLAL